MKKNIAFVLFVFSAFLAISQSVEINEVKNSRFTGVHPITDGEDGEVSGYYTYYMLEKQKKGIRVLEFAIIDKGVKQVNKIPLELHKYANINDIVFNGVNFLISWDDWKNKKTVLKVISKAGKIIKSQEFTYEKRSQVGTFTYPMAEGKGFYVIRNEYRSKVQGYSIQKVDNDLKQIWKKDYIPEKGVKKVSDLVNTNNRLVIWEENAPKGKQTKPSIICMDATTGAKIFEREGYDGASTILYNQLRIDDKGNVYAGGSYVDGIKYKSVNNNGIYLLKLDERGKEVLYNKVDNKDRIQAALKSTSKGFTIGSKDKVFVEDLIIENDQVIVVSEMFRLNANMTPVAIQQTRDAITGKYIGGATDNDKSKYVFQIMDFMLFKFSQKGVLAEIKPITKEDYNKITVWNPYSSMYGMDLAKKMSEFGWFDYSFTTTDNNGKKVMVCKNNASPRKPEVFTYSLDGNYAQTKINLKQEAKIDLEKAKVGYFNSLKNDDGKVVVAYYQKKLKKITINLEELFK